MVLLSQGSTTHTVTFDLDGKGERTGGGALVQQVAHGGAAVAPTVSGLPGWTFTDWDRAFDNVTGPLTVTARYTATPRPDLTLLPSDLRILNASGAETANPAIGERVTLEVTVRNTGAAATSGDILVQLFLDGAPADLVRYDLASYSNVASTVVVESMEVGGSRTLLLPWIATGPDRVATLTAVAEFAANRTQSQANAEGASSPLPVAEAAFDNNATGRSLQLGSPAAGDFGIEVLCTPPSNLLSGVGYPLAGTARYDWGANAPVLGALVTVTVSNQTHTARTVPPDGAWSVTLNGLPAGEHLARVTVSDGRLTGATNLTLLVSAGPETRDLRIADLGFEIGTYRTEGETGYAVTGSDVVVRARVRNDGNAACGAFDVAFKDPSGGVLCTVAVPGGLAAFSETTVIATAGWAAQAGAHQISAVADSGGAVDETNENNNTRVCTVVGTAALPDLIVTGLGFAPGGPKAGDAVTMTATVKNQGAAAVAAGTTLEVAFSVAGATVATGTVAPPSGLAPGASLTVAATHTFAAAGTFAVGVLADSGGAVAETREDNNALAATLSVRQALPDLRPFYMPNGWTTVSGLSFSPSQPVAGEAVTVSCDLYNSGTMPLEADAAFNVVFSADGAPFATHRVTLAADLAAGASVRTAAAWSGGAAGSVTFAAAVDTGNEVAEEHETNNGTSAGLTVYPGGAALVAAGLTTSPLQPLPGAAVTLTATVRNDGGAAGGDGAVVEFFAGSTAPADKLGETALAGDAAAKGGTRTAEFAWRAPATPGVVPLFAKIGDSTVLRNLTVTANPAPNLQVFSEDIRVVPILPQSGEAVTVTATVRNTEGSAATGFWVHFYRDVPGGFWVDLGAPVQVASLAAGAETTVTAGAQIVADRSAYTLKVELRPNTAQGDADAGDNIATSSFLLADTPRADAGADAACFAGQPVALDGTASSNATTYAWTLVEWPAGSEAVLTGADTATPTLTPDLPGLYRLQLVVGDGLVQSDPDTVEVTARWLELTVASAHGTPVPGVGTHALSWMTVVGGRSTSVDEVGPGTRYLCTGWTGTGSVAPHGATTNVSFAITNDSSIVWNWATNHWLAAETAGGSGWLSETGAWHAAGSEASVSAVADDGWRFDRWVVDGQPAEAGTTSSTNGTNTVTDVMDAPKDLTAVFAALDLPEALDNGGRIWTTGGSSNWVGQTRTTFDGEDAAGSGETGDNAQSWLETTVETGGTLRFAWRVSSEAQRDLLRFEVDGQVYGLISGETAWQTVTVSVPYGEHTFRWVYAKGKSGAAGADRGWVDQVVWAPLPPLTLAIAVDATNLVWTTAGDAAWFPQTEVTADGVAAAQSGAVGDLGWSGLTTRVRGSGLLAFEWRVSSEEEYDWLVLLVDGVVQRAVTGESGWQRVQLALEGDGDHELRWEYWKDERLSEGLDAGWLDRVSWSGAVPPEEPPALVGFALWADGRGLAGDAAAIFGQLHPVTGVPYGFEYAFGGSLTPGVPLLTIRLVDGRPVVETPAQDAATLPYVDVRVVGTEDLAAGDWTLPVAPAADTTGKPANRAWHEPAGTPPDKAFFRLEAGLK
jgi:subtilase family serine protease